MRGTLSWTVSEESQMTSETVTALYISSPQIVACVRIVLDCLNWQSELLLQLVWGGSVRTGIPNKFPGDGTATGLETTLKEPFLSDTQEPAMILASPGKGHSE